MFKENTLADKTILITGGGSGLGLEMAKKFASLGANIAICGRTESKLGKASKKIASEGDIQVETYVCDVRDYERVKEMTESIVEDFGAMDGLVNNA